MYGHEVKDYDDNKSTDLSERLAKTTPSVAVDTFTKNSIIHEEIQLFMFHKTHPFCCQSLQAGRSDKVGHFMIQPSGRGMRMSE